MEKTETNQQLKLLLQIAKDLIQEGKSNSFRDFSSNYLNRCSNYLGTLVYQNKSPSVASILTLYFKLNQEKYMPNWQIKLANTLKNIIMKEKKWMKMKNL